MGIKRGRRLMLSLALLSIVLVAVGAARSQPLGMQGSEKTGAVDNPQQPVPKEPAGPVKTDAIDQAGKKIGQGIDQIGNNASKHLGAWINNKIYKQISWLKLLLCLLMLFVVAVTERVLRWTIQRKRDTLHETEGDFSWSRLFLKATVKPLSLFIWVYGAYAALSPLYVHFQPADGFNDWSLNITVVLWYHPPDWWNFQAWLQSTCLDIMRRFESAGIGFAFPSQTLYLAGDDKRGLKLQMLKGEITPQPDA